MAYIFDEKDLANLRRVLESGRLMCHDAGFAGQLEREFAKRIESKYGVAGNSAMSLLHASVNAAGAGAGDEVICDPIVQFGAIATMYNNAHPVFADVDSDTWLMNPESVEKRITRHTKAIVCTNLLGWVCEVDVLREMADDHGIVLIEDCAHSLYAKWKGKNSGTWGHIGVFSFCQGKHMTTGDGGIAVTDDEQLARKIRAMTTFGTTPPELAWNYRITELAAAVALAQLDKVEGYIKIWNGNMKIYDEVLGGCRWLKARHKPEDLTVSAYEHCALFQGDKYGIKLDDFRDAAEDVKLRATIGYLQVPAYRFKLFTTPLAYGNKGCPLRGCSYYRGSFEYGEGLCPVAEDIMPRMVWMPVMTTKENVQKNAELLGEAIRKTEKT